MIYKKYFIISAVFAATFLSAVNMSRAEVIDKVAIVVNDEIITDREIGRQLAPIYERYKTIYSGPKLIEMLDDAKQKVAQQMIEDRLLYGEAKKQGIEVTDKEIDAKVDEVAKNVGSKEGFYRAIAEQQVTMKDLRERYKQQFMIRKLIDRKMGGGVTVTPIEEEEYYKTHQGEFQKPEKVKVKNILISIKKFPEPVKSLNLAKDIAKRLKEGCDFDGLAKTYSDGPGASEGGLMGYVKKGDLLPEIETVIFSLKPGEVSGVVQTSLGYHIFKVEEKDDAKIIAFSEARRDVESAVYRSKADAKIKGWIESMKKSAYIAFK